MLNPLILRCTTPFSLGSRVRFQNTTNKPSRKRATRWESVANTAKGDEATVQPQPQREYPLGEMLATRGGEERSEGLVWVADDRTIRPRMGYSTSVTLLRANKIRG